MKDLLRRRGFRYLLIGQGVSAFGDWMGTIGFMALSLSLTGSAAAVGVVLVLRLLPAMIAGPLATRLVARLDRRRTMLLMDLSRAGIAAVVPLVNAVWWIYLCAFLLELGGVAFLPARDASIPDLVETSDLQMADGLILASSYGTIPFGAAAFAAASAPFSGPHGFAHGGVAPVFWVDAATFVVSFLCIRPLRSLGGAGASTVAPHAGPVPTPRPSHRRGRFLDALRIPLVRIVAPLAFAVALGLGSLFSLGIVFVRKVLHAGNTDFSFLIAFFGVGAGIGLVWVRANRHRGLGLVRFCIVGQGAVIALMSFAPRVWVTFVGAIGFAFFTAASLALSMEVLQRALDEVMRVQAFALFHVLIRAGLAIAAIGAGLAATLVSGVQWPVVGKLPPVRLVLALSGVAVAVLAIVLRGRFVAGARLAALGPEAERIGDEEQPGSGGKTVGDTDRPPERSPLDGDGAEKTTGEPKSPGAALQGRREK